MPLIVTDGFGQTISDIGNPIVSGVTPTPGTSIASTTPIQFAATDDGADFRVIIILINMPTLGIYEVAFDGSQFGPNYLGPSNSMEAITNGFQFSLLRKGGWPAAPTLAPILVDVTGTENA